MSTTLYVYIVTFKRYKISIKNTMDVKIVVARKSLVENDVKPKLAIKA